MGTINLHNIFCHLTGDQNFLSTIIETSDKIVPKKKSKKNKFNLMSNMVTEYIPLSPYETQGFSLFPSQFKPYLTPEYVRYGIKNVVEKDLKPINVSFLISLNILLRPDIYKTNLDEQSRNLSALETFISHKIQRNYQIDKTKNTKKVQMANKEIIVNLSEGKITPIVIQNIVNIFEINLLIFDFRNVEINFYWTKGHKHPYLNFFKNIYCMSYIDGNYEPLMTPNNSLSKEQKEKVYMQILADINDIKCSGDINLFLPSLSVINTWNMPNDIYLLVLEKYFIKDSKNILNLYDEFISFEKNK